MFKCRASGRHDAPLSPPPQTVLRDAKGHGAIDRRYRVHHHSWAPAAWTQLACTFTVVGGPGSVLPYRAVCLDYTPPFCTILWHSSKKTCNVFPRSRIFLPWRWRRNLTPKRRFLQDPHGATSEKTAFIIVTAVNTSNPTIILYYNLGSCHNRDTDTAVKN
jgi:hypothetical protein